jgi:hypothetical protein
MPEARRKLSELAESLFIVVLLCQRGGQLPRHCFGWHHK